MGDTLCSPLPGGYPSVRGPQAGAGERGSAQGVFGMGALCLGCRDLEKNRICSGLRGGNHVHECALATGVKACQRCPPRECVFGEPGQLLVKFAHKQTPGEQARGPQLTPTCPVVSGGGLASPPLPACFFLPGSQPPRGAAFLCPHLRGPEGRAPHP